MQSNYFDQQPADEISPKPYQTPDRPAPKRVFLYDNQVFEDPGREYSNQDVLNFLAGTYPELGNGTWTTRTLPDGTEEITFVKITGDKGATLTPRQLIACLERLQPTELRAVALLDEITACEADETLKLDAARLLAMTPDIEAALRQAHRISTDSQRIVSQCLRLTPMPLPKTPLGF